MKPINFAVKGGRSALFASAGLVALTLASPAMAQDSDDDDAQVEQVTPVDRVGEDEESSVTTPETEAIVVTGSRIRRDTFNTAEPITVVTSEEVTQAGFNSVVDALQSNAVTAGSSQINNQYGNFVVNGGTGVNTLGLRNLGPARTLVLLNGQRLAPAGTRGAVGSVDLNTLPTSIVERVEVLKAGASSIYGSDAIAGVVNVITRSNLDGLVIDGQVNFPETGEGVSRRLAVSAGAQGDRFRVLGSVEYFKRDALPFGASDYNDCVIEGRLNGEGTEFGSGDNIDPATGEPQCFTIYNGGVTINTLGIPTRPGVDRLTGAVGNFNRFVPAPGQTTGPTPGYLGVGLYSRDSFDPRILEADLITPAETITGYFEAGYDSDILGNAEFYASILATQRKSSNTSFRQLSLDYNQGSILLPETFRNGRFLAGTETSSGNAVAARAFIGFGLTTTSQEVDFARVGGGVRGDFLLPGWQYDLYLGKSYSDAEYSGFQFLTNRLANSLDVVRNADGNIVCRTQADVNCVPAPALSVDVIAGRLPQAFVDYVSTNDVGTTKFRETVTSFNINGPIFALPGGDVQLALGAEYRENRIDDTPSENSQNNNLFGFSSSSPTRGSDSVWEAYGEVFLPLLADVPFAENLSLNASGRYTNYESYGADFTYKVGGEYEPFRGLGFRASYGTSYRAPALFEQFLGRTSGFLSQSADPCDTQSSTPNATVAANCLAEGLPANFVQNASVRSIRAGGAETGLEAETSKNLSFGAVLRPPLPSSLGDFALAVDYFDIEVNNGVQLLGATTVLAQCYNQVAGFQPGVGRCANVSRDAANVLTAVGGYQNVSTDIVRGIEGNLRYSRTLGPGSVRLNALVTHYLEQLGQTLPTDALRDSNGTIGEPEWVGTFDATYEVNRFLVRYGLTWVGKTDQTARFVSTSAATGELNEDTLEFVNDNFQLDTPDYFLHTLSAQWRLDDFVFTAGVRNLFDRDPPRVTGGTRLGQVVSTRGNAALDSNYDYFGRTFFINTTFEF